MCNMQKYTQLTKQQRYHIYLMKKQQNSLTIIAKSLNRSVSRISNEIKHNTGNKDYFYK